MIILNVREELKKGVSIYDLPLRVAYYARVSTEHDLQVSSIINQVDFFSRLIQSHSNWRYVSGYVDFGISGKSVLKRENFLRMMEDAKKGSFDLILTKSVSRFARNTIDSIRYTDILLQFGIGVLFVNDNINTFYSDSEFRLTLMASIAQDELRKLSESVQFGLQQSIHRGVVLGNSNILGYCKDCGRLKIISSEAEIVRDIFSLFATGRYCYMDLARLIHQKYNIYCDSTKVKRILTNYKYKGFYCGRKSQVVDYKRNKRKNIESFNWVIYRDYKHVPPIVDEKLWDSVQKLIKKKRDNTMMFDRYKGIVFCGIHGGYLKLKKKRYKTRWYGYLVCPSCIRFSCNILDRIWKVCQYNKVVVFRNIEDWIYLVCQK